MKKILPVFLFIFSAFSALYSQTNTDTTTKKKFSFKKDHYLDLSVGLGENVVINSFQWDKLFPIALKKRIKIGFGARMNIMNYWNKNFFTAPPQQKPGTSFDTLRIAHQTTFFLNLQFLAEIALLKWWDIGMNIDAVGFSWGPVTPASYYSNSFGHNGTTQNTSPENLNLMLFGKNDFGNLNSQFYLRFWPSHNVSIKTGMSLATLTNLTESALSDGNSRFHAGSYMGFLSLCWTPGKSEWVSCKKKSTTTQ